MLRLSLIFLAGGAGCILRFLLAGWIQGLGGAAPQRFPVGTLAANLLGCLVIGFVASLLTGPMLIRDEYRLAILVGLLGGFTTFSTFAWETLVLASGGQFLLATANIVISNVAGLLAAWGGSRLALVLYGP